MSLPHDEQQMKLPNTAAVIFTFQLLAIEASDSAAVMAEAMDQLVRLRPYMEAVEE